MKEIVLIASDKLDYNIPSNNRDLQQMWMRNGCRRDYNIPNNNRDLQLNCSGSRPRFYYKIPRFSLDYILLGRGVTTM